MVELKRGRPAINTKRDERIVELVGRGWPLTRIAKRYGISYQRVGQIVNKRTREKV